MTPQQPCFPPPTHNLATIWRSKSLLVMTKEALLPDRCVKCNAPTGDRLKRKLSWHHPAIYLTILVSILIYVVIALVLRKSATVNVGLCEDHATARRRNLGITWALGMLAVVCFPIAGVFEDVLLLFVGIIVLLATAIYGTVTLRVVVPTRIDDQFVWLKGINPNYLHEFPEWHGRA